MYLLHHFGIPNIKFELRRAMSLQSPELAAQR